MKCANHIILSLDSAEEREKANYLSQTEHLLSLCDGEEKRKLISKLQKSYRLNALHVAVLEQDWQKVKKLFETRPPLHIISKPD